MTIMDDIRRRVMETDHPEVLRFQFQDDSVIFANASFYMNAAKDIGDLLAIVSDLTAQVQMWEKLNDAKGSEAHQWSVRSKAEQHYDKLNQLEPTIREIVNKLAALNLVEATRVEQEKLLFSRIEILESKVAHTAEDLALLTAQLKG